MTTTVEVPVLIIRETETAMKVRPEENHDGIWINKKLVSNQEPSLIGGITLITIPEWLAHKEGMI